MEITKEYLVSIIDSTLLKPNATKKDIEFLCEEAVLYSFGAVCIRPCDVEYVSQLLEESNVKVCTVIGFPWGIQTLEGKICEASEAVENGATEIDMVINRGYLKGKDYDLLEAEIRGVVESVKPPCYFCDSNNLIISTAQDANRTECCEEKDDRVYTVKVILETCELTDEEIVKACLIAKEAGADYVKTSTGLYKGANVKDVRLMHKTVPELGVKASGGIKDWKKVERLIRAGATRIGTSSGVKILSEFLTQNQK